MTTEEILTETKALMDQAADYHRQGRHALSLQCYQKAIALARPLGDAGMMSYLLAQAGIEHRDCDNYYHAVDLLVAALAIIPDAEEMLQLRAGIKKKLAITFADIYGPQKLEVLQLLEESRRDYVCSGDVGQEANVLQHIGGCYIQLGRLSEADTMLTEALRKAQVDHDVQLEGWIYDDMAALEIERNDWGLALEYTRTARRKAWLVQDSEGEGDTWVTEARVLLRMGHPEDALTAAQRALEIYSQNQNLRRTIRARRHIAKAFIRLGQVEDAAMVLDAAMQIAVRLDLRRDQAMIHLDIGKMELERKNYGLVHQHAISTRTLAETEDIEYLVTEADDLLRRCNCQEHGDG